VLTTVAAGVATPEIASAAIASGLRPPAFTATAVSGAAPLRATAAAQAQHVGRNEAPTTHDSLRLVNNGSQDNTSSGMC
jgi:hypothetical protein